MRGRALVGAYWFGMALPLGVAFLIGSARCAWSELCGDEVPPPEPFPHNYDAWQWGALQALAVFAFLAALLVFASRVRLWRLVVYAIHLGLTALVVLLVWLSRDVTILGEDGAGIIVIIGPVVSAIGGELAALRALDISWRRPSTQASGGR